MNELHFSRLKSEIHSLKMQKKERVKLTAIRSVSSADRDSWR